VRSPRSNGFTERFIRTVKEKFISLAFRKKIYVLIEDLQEQLDQWLQHYNHKRPHRGYRNFGRRPIDTVKEFVKVQE
jgi:transposase InsO family protein